MSEIEAIFAALDEHGMLVEGVEAGAAPLGNELSTPVEPALAGRQLHRLVGHLFQCAGSGPCCEQYASITLTDADLVRAGRAGLYTLPGDPREERVVLPLYGINREERLAMTLVDGRCLQLTPSRHCGLHERGGAQAKPTACQVYPATLVDDGEEVRLALATECDCAFLRATTAQGAPLLAPAETLGELPSGITIRRLPSHVPLSESRMVSASRLSAWSRRAMTSLPEARVPHACAALALALESGELHDFDKRELQPDLIQASELLRVQVGRLANRMFSAAEAAASWRSRHDHTRRLREAVAEAGRRLADEATWLRAQGDEGLAADEIFALRIAIFGHHLVGIRPFATTLSELGARLLLARELRLVAPDLGHPIAAVMAAVRGSEG